MAFILTLNIVVPASAATASSSIIEVTSNMAPAREGPGKSYSTVATLQVGDCLTVTGTTYNSYGNKWYICQYNNRTVYLYSSHAVLHSHTYRYINTGVSVCRCGYYSVASGSSLIRTGAIAATAGSLLTAEIVSAAAKLAASAGTAAGAFPVVAVVSIGGMLIHMGVSRTGAQINDVVAITNDMSVYDILERDYDSYRPFHKSCIVPNSAALLIDRNGMDKGSAAKYLRDIVGGSGYTPYNTITSQAMPNIWTWNIWDANNLGLTFSKFGPNYGYGNSKDSNCQYEDNVNKYVNNIYFQHYHVWYAPPYIDTLKKNRDVHIFFGLPTYAKTA